MLAKLTSRNRLTLPKAVMSAVEGSEYLDVTEENGRIVLTPVRVNRADAVRAEAGRARHHGDRRGRCGGLGACDRMTNGPRALGSRYQRSAVGPALSCCFPVLAARGVAGRKTPAPGQPADRGGVDPRPRLSEVPSERGRPEAPSGRLSAVVRNGRRPGSAAGRSPVPRSVRSSFPGAGGRRPGRCLGDRGRRSPGAGGGVFRSDPCPGRGQGPLVRSGGRSVDGGRAGSPILASVHRIVDTAAQRLAALRKTGEADTFEKMSVWIEEAVTAAQAAA